MKDNLEKAFKEKLDQYEAPHDASAWDAMNKRLDAQQSTGGNNLLKWISGSAALIAVVAVGSYFLTREDTNQPVDRPEIAEQTTEQTSNTSTEDQETDETTVRESIVNEHQSSDETNSLNHEELVNEEKASSSEESQEHITGNDEDHLNTADESTVNDGTPTNIQSNDDGTPEKPAYNFVAGNLSSDQICKGESITITNNNGKNAIIKLQIDGDVISLKKEHSHTFKPATSGTVQFLNGDNQVIGKQVFTVFETPNPEFSMKANIFKDGLPVTNCETYGDYESVTWTFGKEKHIVKGRKATHHFFKKGEHDVILTVEDFNGCKNSLTKKVRIEDDYNLMAVDAFKPNGTDPRNKVFMPFSLTQRDVQFTLTIVDPRDNSVIYSTQDATKGWDGHDQRTGKMTPSETVYIWKVQLENPLPNERQVYAGTVVHN